MTNPLRTRYVMRAVIISLLAIVLPAHLHPCSRVSPVDPVEMVAQADLILRVAAIDYGRPPSDPNVITTGTPDSIVRFRVEERIKGRVSPLELELPGYLRDSDDFNDRPVPYDFVRPGGRAGSCFANTYRPGAEYLLFLKWREGAYTVEWYALGPTNEQLRDSNDPWLKWVKDSALRDPERRRE